MLSPTAWKASHEGLKVLTLVPNPIRKSPQTHVTCGWKRILMHKYYNMSMHQYFLCFVTLFGCLLINCDWLKFVCLFLQSIIYFFLLILIILFLLLCQKSKNLIKSRKSKSLIDIVEFLSQNYFLPCTFVLMALCIYERSLFLCTLIAMEEILKSMWLL